jgi:hypothetical protein
VIKENLQKVQKRILDACKKNNRNPDDITLIAVTKTVDASYIEEAIKDGINNIGENKVQELESKNIKGATTHLIGHLQSNKVKKAVELADIIHSVDSIKIAKLIEKHSPGHKVLIQINTSNEITKSGLTPSDTETIEKILELNIEVLGLMTIGPNTSDQQKIQKSFQTLRALREEYNLAHLSMGMSNDFELAIKEDATMLRIGSAIFGERN